MAYLADHAAEPRVRRNGSYGSLYPEEIRYLNRPVTKDADQPKLRALRMRVHATPRRLVCRSAPELQLQKL